MARRKRTQHRHTHRRKHTPGTNTGYRRRRIGATALNFSANSPLVKWGSVALGYFMPTLIPLSKVIGDKVDPKIVSAGTAGIGLMLTMKRGKKSLPLTILGGYLLGSGVKNAMTAFGIGGIGPYGRVPVIGAPFSPYGRVPVISGRMAGYTPNNSLNGYNPHGTINRVMNGVSSGSGLMNSDSGSSMMN
jgi:hypothetical protein